jgi:anti-anti-sigma regulatory factor
LPISVERLDSQWSLQLEGDLTLVSAPELKALLLEWLASGKDLRLDLERADQIDLSVLQLLWAAGREAARSNAVISSRVSEVAMAAAREAGFDSFPAGNDGSA